MLSASQNVWHALDRPDCQRPTGATEALCALCGAPCGGVGVRQRDAIAAASFSDWRDLAVPGSGYLCRACTWSMRGRPPDTIRMWSVLWREDEKIPKSLGPWGAPAVHLNNKSDLSAFVDILRNPPQCRWLVALADSGQIHTLAFAPVNLPCAHQWGIRFERNDVRAGAGDFRLLHDTAVALYRAGFSRNDIFTGEVRPPALCKHGIDVWREHRPRIAPWFNSKLLELACFFLRKELRNER